MAEKSIDPISEFLNNTSLSSFTSPQAASTAVKKDNRDDAFLKKQNMEDILQNLFMTQESSMKEKTILNLKPCHDVKEQVERKANAESSNSLTSGNENSSLGLLSIDSITDLSGSVIPFELSQKMMSTTARKLTKEDNLRRENKINIPTRLKVHINNEKKLETVSHTDEDGSDVSSDVELDAEDLKQLDTDFENFTDIGETDDNDIKDEVDKSKTYFERVINLKKPEIFTSTTEKEPEKLQEGKSSNKLKQSEEFKLPSDETNYKLFQDVKRDSNNQSSKVLSITPCGSFENEPSGNTSVSRINSRYFHPAAVSSTSVNETSTLNYGNKSEVNFQKEEISSRSSSYGTYKKTESPSKSKKLLPNSRRKASHSFNISDESEISDSLSMTGIPSYLHSTRYDGKRVKEDRLQETGELSPLGTPERDIMSVIHAKLGLSGITRKSSIVKEVEREKPSVAHAPIVGDYITDLAFQTDLCKEIQFDNKANSESFFSADEAAKMLEKDEIAFNDLHMFEMNSIKDQTQTNINNSWMPPSHQDITRPSWCTDKDIDDKAGMRISVGEFMAAKTEALGSLEGCNLERPTFGIQFPPPDTSKTGIFSINPNEHSSITTEKISIDNYVTTPININDPTYVVSSDSENSLLSTTTIMKIMEQASVSEDPNILAAKCIAKKKDKTKRDAKRFNKILKEKANMTDTILKSRNIAAFQVSQDSGVHSDLLKTNSNQEISSSSSASQSEGTNSSRSQNLLKSKSEVLHTFKGVHSTMDGIGDRTDLKNRNDFEYKLYSPKIRKSLSIQTLSNVGANDSERKLIQSRTVSDTDLTSPTGKFIENSSHTEMNRLAKFSQFPVKETMVSKNRSDPGGKVETATSPISASDCFSASLPNLTSVTGHHVCNNYPYPKCHSSFGSELNQCSNNSTPSLTMSSQSPAVCSTVNSAPVGISSCSYSSSNHIHNHQFTKFNPSATCVMSSTYPVAIPYGTSLQSVHPVPFIPAVLNANNFPNYGTAGCCHGVLLEADNGTKFINSCPLQLDDNSVNEIQSVSTSTTAQNTNIKRTVELKVSEPICIGDTKQFNLVLQNPSLSCLLCNLKVNVSIDEQILPAGTVSGFEFPHHVQIESGGMKKIQIKYTPRQKGNVTAVLEVNADSTTPVFGYPLTAVITAQVEWPQISMKIDDAGSFGTVGENQIMKRLIMLTNNGTAVVPIRICISEVLQCAHCFSFGVQEINSDEYKGCNTIWHFLSSKILFCRLAARNTKNTLEEISFPIILQTRKIKEGTHEPVSAILNATLESSVMYEALGSIRLNATVGTVKLSVKEANQGIFTLTTKPKCEVSKQVTLQNEGSILVKANLEFKVPDTNFKIFPKIADLNPGSTSSLHLTFCPHQKLETQENILQAVLENGVTYQLLTVKGECKSKRERKVTVIRRSPKIKNSGPKSNKFSSTALVSNKNYLTWGGVDIGKSVEKKLTLRNSSSTESISIKVKLKSNKAGFQLEEQLSEHSELCFQPQEMKTFRIMFCPTDVAVFKSNIIIKCMQMSECSGCFTIPLLGYGGIGKINLSSINRKDDGSYCLDVTPKENYNIAQSCFVINNIGQRACYGKVMFFSDSNLNHALPASVVTADPPEFVILPHASQTLFVKYNYVASSVTLSSSSSVGTLAIFHGDELLRQKLKKSAERSDVETVIPPYPLGNINFAIKFPDEDDVPYDPSYSDSPNDIELFYDRMSLCLVNLEASVEDVTLSNSSSHSVVTLIELQGSYDDNSNGGNNSTLEATAVWADIEEKYPDLLSPPVKGSSEKKQLLNVDAHLSASEYEISLPYDIPDIPDASITNKENLLISQNKNNDRKWTIDPTVLHLNADGKDGRLCLHNMSDTDLKFRLEWSTNVLCVSPVQGIVLARNTIGLRVNPVISSPSIKTQGRRKGFVNVICGGKKMEITVHIHSRKLPVPKKQVQDVMAKRNSTPNKLCLKSPLNNNSKVLNTSTELRVYCPSEVKLQSAKFGNSSETTFQIKNKTNTKVKWNFVPLHTFSAKISLGMNETKELSSSTINLNKEFGILNPNEVIDIKVTFHPFSLGIHSESWELNLSNAEKMNVRFCGECYVPTNTPLDDKTQQDDLNLQTRVTDMNTERRTVGRPVFPVTEVLEFPSTEIGKSVTLKVKLKNLSNADHKISILAPPVPFFIKYTDLIIKSKFYLHLPVVFSPPNEKHFHETLLIRTDMGYDVNITLKGKGKVT